MKVLLQRVRRASVEIDGREAAAIGRGLLLLVGISKDDEESLLEPMAAKIANLRVFPDEQGRFHYSVLDIKGELLAVPQFTLFGDTGKGRRPDFFQAMRPPRAAEMFEMFVERLGECSRLKVEQGVFGAEMLVSLENEGPVTLMLES